MPGGAVYYVTRWLDTRESHRHRAMVTQHKRPSLQPPTCKTLSGRYTDGTPTDTNSFTPFPPWIPVSCQFARLFLHTGEYRVEK